MASLNSVSRSPTSLAVSFASPLGLVIGILIKKAPINSDHLNTPSAALILSSNACSNACFCSADTSSLSLMAYSWNLTGALSSGEEVLSCFLNLDNTRLMRVVRRRKIAMFVMLCIKCTVCLLAGHIVIAN
ncbi:hypothetical protein BX661DRAFT_182935 [Kickxella alabastrina]|uniref:uncharacterized protein n=1 Tax=Kickxella alabastrina TaxID=61397 RepID=UPI002220A7E9|nr:uncharacterized protein BX661DRAFT_182935 [Kickxella alabastrina]KAI7827254.1 hypothetical protein BX661DRAFT_182935 [Kickxella alabastrina]